MSPQKTINYKVRKRLLATALLALAGLALSACAPPPPLTLQESTSKVVSDLRQLSGAIDEFTATKGFSPPSGALSGELGKELLAAGVLRDQPKPPTEVKRTDFSLELYKYEYFPQFDEIGGPTARGNDAALVLHGVTADACRRINEQDTPIGGRIPNHREEGYFPNVPLYCTDFGGGMGYTVLKYQSLR